MAKEFWNTEFLYLLVWHQRFKGENYETRSRSDRKGVPVRDPDLSWGATTCMFGK